MNAPTVRSHLLHPFSELQLVPVDTAVRSYRSHWFGQSHSRFPPSVAAIGQTPSNGCCITDTFPSTTSLGRLVECIQFLWRHIQTLRRNVGSFNQTNNQLCVFFVYHTDCQLSGHTLHSEEIRGVMWNSVQLQLLKTNCLKPISSVWAPRYLHLPTRVKKGK
jgi:hypothetical protein